MKIYFNILLIFCSTLLFSQKLIHPKYVFTKDIQDEMIEKTSDPNLFTYNQVRYIGKIAKKIKIQYDYNFYSEIRTEILKQNYRRKNEEVLYRELKYQKFILYADVSQKIPALGINTDSLKLEFVDADLVKKGSSFIDEMPSICSFYDGFPITIYNFEDNEKFIGFGNNVFLEFEALSKENKWETITKVRKYSCGNDKDFFVLKPGEIATVLVPRLHGNFKTRFRYRLGNVVSNEFEGSIDEKYIGKN